ncbi:hypothetical protein INT43_008341 [Umbelopsis isabellina]|uniref:Xylanolytic transcriptional activator regulatory domain-containing protein n=1 Tax=Mortierella isabellina TaxID=91625 RepID=A0A8H7PCY6_MORIS|nr:hypothetical protein INT43_008341 [Umbelopsis isabellina]
MTSTLKEILDRVIDGSNPIGLYRSRAGVDRVSPDSDNDQKEQQSISHLLSRMPGKEECEEVLELFYKYRHSLNFIVHWPTFHDRFEKLTTGIESTLSFVALVAGIMAQGKQVLSYIVDSKERRTAEIRTSQDLYQLSVDALCLADSYESPYDLDYIQAGVVQCDFALHCIDRGPIERRIWPRWGTFVTIAMQMGLHRDPEASDSFSAFEQEMRRRTWWNVYIYDRSLSNKLLYPPHVNDREVTCKIPANINDDDISPSVTTIQNLSNITNKWFFFYQCHAGRLVGVLRELDLREPDRSLESTAEIAASIELLISSIPPETDSNPKMEMHRCIARMCINSLSVKLYHRYIQTPDHPLYTSAMSSILNSCHNIIAACQRIVEMSQHGDMALFVPNFWYSPYIFTAGVMIAICLLQNSSKLYPEIYVNDIETAYKIFQKLSEGASSGETSNVLKIFHIEVCKMRQLINNGTTMSVCINPTKLSFDMAMKGSLQYPLEGVCCSSQNIPVNHSDPNSYITGVSLLDQINIGISMDHFEAAIFELDDFRRFM